MKLLIVEDNSTLAETLYSLDGQAQQIEAITLALDLRTTVLCNPEHDAALCDGTFRLTHKPRFLVEDWGEVRQEAIRRGIHFVLPSGSIRALECTRDSGTLVLVKPAAIAEIYAALSRYPLPVVAKSPRESGRITESVNLAGESYVPDL